MRGWTELAEPELPSLREVVARHAIAPRKSLGQNFLFDLNLTRRIARAAGPLSATTIYEVGPGPGGLTRALLAEGATRVIAVERDPRCIAALNELALAYPGRLEVIEADALALDEAALFAAKGVTGPVRIAANLPYNIGSALLVKWLSTASWTPFWHSLTLMFQREVALRLVATPRTSAYGRLSVLSQWRTEPQLLFDVHPSAFTPAPKVVSSVVRIEPLPTPRAPCSLRALERVTAAGFGNRRKMLRQSLKALFADVQGHLLHAGILPTARAEELDIADFAALARELDDTAIRR
ncbi:MAG: 16S rRNA (adenine(1518)-N(6)/adenine(1519)-N(6))-dimethyltransferase RsmA [Rhizomicrobium sp.]